MRVSRYSTGYTLSETLVVIGIIGILLSLLLPAIQRVRGLADRLQCQTQLSSIGRALTSYTIDRRVYPPALLTWPQSQAFLHWHARLLPYLDHGQLWRSTQVAFQQEPLFWLGPHVSIRSSEVSAFVCPSDGRKLGVFNPPNPPAAFSHYLAVSGDATGYWNGVLIPNGKIRPSEIVDGFSNTVLVGERPPSANERFGWWYAGIGQDYTGTLDSHMAVRQHNQTFYAPTCPLGPYPFQRGSVDDMCSTFHFWSLHPGGAHFLFADGSARFLAYSADSVLPALATRADKEPPVVLD